MKVLIRAAAVAGILASAAVGSAGLASAETPSGAYTARIGTPSAEQMVHTWTFTPCGSGCEQMVHTWTFTPCGSGCVRVNQGNSTTELHLDGTTWSGSTPVEATTCATVIDDASLTGSWGCGIAMFPLQLTR